MTCTFAIPKKHISGGFIARAGGLLRKLFNHAALAAVALAGMASAASAETLLMPNRDMLAGASEVVWGITTLPNTTSTYRINYGDGLGFSAAAVVTDRSYIALNKMYALPGPYTVTLEVTNGATVETATTTVVVFNGATLSAFALRELNVNRAIQDGLRYLWFSQANRTTFNTTAETFWDWGSFDNAGTSLAVLAFQNQGYQLSNNDNAAVGLYQKYAVRRGINYVLARLTTLNIPTLTPAGNDACTVYGPPPCTALYAATTFDEGYENGIVKLALAGSGALNRTNVEVAVANVANKKYGEILQRMVNASIWGQGDTSHGRGGWDYNFNSDTSDGSTDGWQLLGLLDAEAAGMTVPQWVKNEWRLALVSGLNNDGSFDYRTSLNSQAFNSAVNVAKTGVGVQGMFFGGRLATDPDLARAKTWIGARWQNQNTGQSFVCQNGTYNKGCAYGMFNVFKGFRLFGIPTLAGVNRPAGPGPIPTDSWYDDYVDWLLANQTLPTTTAGGNWSAMAFSSQTTNTPAQTALGLLMLSPTALVLPDPVVFATVGLQQGLPLSTNPSTNPVTVPPGTHMVTGITVATNGSPIPGVTLTFKVLSGPNAGAAPPNTICSGITNAAGQVACTYTGAGGAGTDLIQANVGALLSNVLVKNWVLPVMTCDMNSDGKIDRTDILAINALRNQPASVNPRADADFSGLIDVVDARICATRCTKAACAP